MKVKTCWVEQVSESAQPYILHCTMTKAGRKLAVSCDIYAEWIDNDKHRLFVEAQPTAEKFINAIVEKCLQYEIYLTKDDVHAIRKELSELKERFTD